MSSPSDPRAQSAARLPDDELGGQDNALPGPLPVPGILQPAQKQLGGHGAQPQATKDPIVIASQLVIALQTIASRETHPLDAVVVTVGHAVAAVDVEIGVRSGAARVRAG